jgi:hypothetical protein
VQPIVSASLLARLQQAFPADIAGMANKSPDQRAQIIGEQRVLQVIQRWHDEQDSLLIE